MTEILQGLFFCIIGASFFACLICACACRTSGIISQEDEYGAPEGAYPTPEQKLLRH